MDLTNRLRGKRVACLESNGNVLSIRLEDGGVVDVVWVNDNGEVLKGRPLIATTGGRIHCAGMRELTNMRAAGIN